MIEVSVLKVEIKYFVEMSSVPYKHKRLCDIKKTIVLSMLFATLCPIGTIFSPESQFILRNRFIKYGLIYGIFEELWNERITVTFVYSGCNIIFISASLRCEDKNWIRIVPINSLNWQLYMERCRYILSTYMFCFFAISLMAMEKKRRRCSIYRF